MKTERVVCIDDSYTENDSKHALKFGYKLLTKGEIYTIRFAYKSHGFTWFLLDEIINPKVKGKEIGYNSDRFRSCDDTFGEFVESTVMKKTEYEHAII